MGGFLALITVVAASVAFMVGSRQQGHTGTYTPPTSGGTVRPNPSGGSHRPPHSTSTRSSTSTGSGTSTRLARPSTSSRPTRPSISTPEERDHNLREFIIVDPEGEVHNVDTRTDASFSGPVWTRIFTALTEENEFLRGRAVVRRRNAAENRFSGYDILIDGVTAFLPRSRAGYYFDENMDASGRCIAVKPHEFYPAGRFKGKFIVDARLPLQVLTDMPKPDGGRWALAVDVDQGYLVFLTHKKKAIRCPLDQVRLQARRQGLSEDAMLLTGLYAHLDLTSASGMAQVRSFCV